MAKKSDKRKSLQTRRIGAPGSSAKSDLAQYETQDTFMGGPKLELDKSFPVQRFAFGGSLGDMSLLDLAAMGVRPIYTPEEQAYIDRQKAEYDAYNAKIEEYNRQVRDYQAAVEAYNTQYGAPYQKAADEYNAAVEAYNRDIYNPYVAQAEAYNNAVNAFINNLIPVAGQTDRYTLYEPVVGKTGEIQSVRNLDTGQTIDASTVYGTYDPETKYYLARSSPTKTTVLSPVSTDKTSETYKNPYTGQTYTIVKGSTYPIAAGENYMIRGNTAYEFPTAPSTVPTAPTPFSLTAPTAPPEFTGTAPVAPSMPTTAEKEVQSYIDTAKARAQRSAANRVSALRIAANPEEYGLSGLSINLPFKDGGPVSTDQFIRARANGSPERAEVSNEDFIEQMMTSTGPRIMAQASQEPDVVRAKDITQPATRSAQAMQAYLQASIPDLRVVEDPMLERMGRRGQVSMDVPNVISISPKERAMGREAVLLHEAEHSRAGKAVQGMPEDEQFDNDIRFDRLYGDTGNTRSRLVRNFVDNKDKIEKFFGVNIPDVYFEKLMYKNQSRSGSAGALFEEQIATLSALEQLTNKSITKGMPELFPDDKAAAIYDAITGLRQTRLDAKDLPPNTPQYKSGLDWIKEKLRMRADGSPEWGEVAGQMTFGTPMTEQEQDQPSVSRQALDALIGAGKQVGANLKEAVTSPATFHKRALGNIAKQLQDNPQEFIMNWTGGGLGGIIRPKGGGNLLSGEVERAIDPLLPKVSGRRPSEVLEEMKRTYPPESLFRLSEETGRLVEDSFQSLERSTALENWIKDKFGNYIKKQMGTEDDPVRKLADEMSEKVQADYQAGLKRIAKMKEDIAKAKARGKNTDVSERELADEIDRVEEAFQNASILPIQLGPYTHVTSSLGEAREKAGMSPFPIAKSSQGRSYEELADTPFVPLTKKEIDSRIKTAETMGRGWAPDAPNFTENPWLSKLGEEDLVYRIRAEDLNEKQIFTHTIDELRNALNPNSGLPQNLLLKPEDMQGLGIEKAFRHVNKINDWRAQQRIAANLEEAKRSAVTIKEYPDTPKKLQWQQLKPMEYTELPPGYSINSTYEGPALFGPDGKKITNLGEDPKFDSDPRFSPLQKALNFLSKNDLEKALQYEGSTMRHCVGGYCNSVWTGETNIFSLRDKKGEPHVTIETAPPDIRREGNTPLDFWRENQRLVANMPLPKDTMEQVNWNRQIIQMPEFQEWLRSKPAEILQIKGKGNAKPKEEYIPFVQDFIKSQQWSHISDIGNTDLVTLKPGLLKNARDRGFDVNVITEQNGNTYITKQEFNRLANLFGGMNVYPN